MKLRLNHKTHVVSGLEKKLLVVALIGVTLFLIPTLTSIKNAFIHGGYRALHVDKVAQITQLASDFVSAPYKWLFSDSDIPILRLDIRYKEWQKITADRQRALAEGLIPEDRQYAKALIHDDDQSFDADIRLQGDLLDHVAAEDRWSLRVELKKNGAKFDTRRFSLLSSSVRGHHGPELFRHTMKFAGFDIVAPRHEPVRVVVNGDDWGVMLMEQTFGQDLLAMNNRTEGMVVRLDLLQETVDDKGEIRRLLRPRVIQEKTILRKPELSRQRQIALSLVDDFLNGKRTASDVFDANKLGQYLATVDLWGAWHALTWNNWRWYYNPHTAKLEPIQSDVDVTPNPHRMLMHPPTQEALISIKMLQDPLVAVAYDSALAHLSALVDDGTLFASLGEFQQGFMNKLYTSSPLLRKYDFRHLKTQSDCLQGGYDQPACAGFYRVDDELHVQMQQMASVLPWSVAAHYVSVEDESDLTMVNTELQPLVLHSVSRVNGDDSLTALSINDLPLTIGSGDALTIALQESADFLQVEASVAGGKKQSVRLRRDLLPLSFIPRPQNDVDISDYPFIKVTQNGWTIKRGKWTIDDYLVTPNHWTVRIEPGTTLQFTEDAGLMVFGSLMVQGQERRPVIFRNAEQDKTWQGVAVMGTQRKSSTDVRHMQVLNARSPKLGNWTPRGAVYFVNSWFKAEHLSIRDNQSEDGLNGINSQIVVNHLTIENGLSDGFDCDFCTGSIRDSQFITVGLVSGGDAIDVSGSNIKVEDSYFEQIGDKAISAGENSKMDLYNIIVVDSNIAVVAKDRSNVVADTVRMRNIKEYSLMSYTKKPIFGDAQLAVSNVSCVTQDCGGPLAEGKSVLTVDGVPVASENVNVKALYKGIMKSDKPQ